MYPGFSIKDHTRATIQMLSTEVAHRTIYTHLGFRKLTDQWVYLHAGGAIGTFTDIEVDVRDNLTICKVLSDHSTFLFDWGNFAKSYATLESLRGSASRSQPSTLPEVRNRFRRVWRDRGPAAVMR